MSTPDSSYPPSSDHLTYMAKQIVLQPRKFGVFGSYSREMLHAEASQDYAFALEHLAMRLVTSVLSGQTISAEPKVELNYPASWWQHWKFTFDEWVNIKHYLWRGHRADGSDTTPSPWLILLWPLLALWPRWLKKHPVKFAKMTADVDFEQDVLYPQIDMPPSAGMPVIYETMSILPVFEPTTEVWGTSLRANPPRFMSKVEIISAARREMASAQYRGDDVWAFVDWLESKGVNAEQLVKRR